MMKDTIKPRCEKRYRKQVCKVGSVARHNGPATKAIHIECSEETKDLYLQRAMAVHARNQQDRAYRKMVAVPKKNVCPTIINYEV